jgi:endonuclease YncB( thermonuclease family)
MSSIVKLVAVAMLLAGAPGLGAAPALAQDVVTGPAKVIDGDIIQVDKTRVILLGVDAPERTQKCKVGKLDWACYEAARNGLGELIAPGQASCTLNDDMTDIFKRRYGVCTSDGKDVGAEMVRLGYARAYIDPAKKVDQGTMYLPQEAEAKAAKAGIWQDGADVMDPWVWRAHDPRAYR